MKSDEVAEGFLVVAFDFEANKPPPPNIITNGRTLMKRINRRELN